eukprot:TRINITY_DN16665_c0_g1_i1.p1 TRINITY_DN16665_c0_g1~~TRINITY_DN16665_c0_g1_i1.p1  ORF type:complete len:115 (-),score=21.77 TRINITY_DN16665_c0_g1_i1:60-404(-)
MIQGQDKLRKHKAQMEEEDYEISATTSWREAISRSVKAKQADMKKKREKEAQAAVVPFSYYKFVRCLCFDRCIRDMDNKVTDMQEESCFRECSTSLVDVAKNFKHNSASFKVDP